MTDQKAKKCSPPSLNDHGFSLFELLVVCALIGIMVALSVPSLREALFSDPLKTTARKTMGLVNGVRELALRTQQPYFLHISRPSTNTDIAIVHSGQNPGALIGGGIALIWHRQPDGGWMETCEVVTRWRT